MGHYKRVFLLSLSNSVPNTEPSLVSDQEDKLCLIWHSYQLKVALRKILVSANAFFTDQRSKLKLCYSAKRKLTMDGRWSTRGRSSYARGAYAYVERQRLSNVLRCNTCAIKSRVKELERHIEPILCAEALVTDMEIMHTVYLLSYLCFLGRNILLK